MQRIVTIVAFFFVCIDCFSQVSNGQAANTLAETSGQYPFVYYTPKQGLINSRVRNIMQDDKGRMLFLTFAGLSIYDGTRFINYTQEDGLAFKLVNDMVELAPDSFLLATNTQKLNTFVHDKVGQFTTADGYCPVVNHFLKSKDGHLYIAADEGLFILKDRRFIRLPVTDAKGSDIGRNLEGIKEWKNYLFLIPWNELAERLIIYDKQRKRLVATSYEIQNITEDRKGRLWASYKDGLKLLDTSALENGKINLLPPPSGYSAISNIKNAVIFFDKNNDLWLNAGGQLKVFPSNSPKKLISIGLKTFTLTSLMQDREGTLWLSTDGNGVVKIPGVNLQLINGFVPGHPVFVSGMQRAGDTVWFYSATDNTIVRSVKNNISIFPVHDNRMDVQAFYVINRTLSLLGNKTIVCIADKDNPDSYLHPKFTSFDSVSSFGAGVTDPYGAIITYFRYDSTYFLSVIKENKELMRYKIGYMGDEPAIDKSGRLWVINRQNQLLVFSLHPDQPGKYLQFEKDVSSQLPVMSMRSIAIDQDNNVWIGTRNEGVFILKFHELNFVSATHFNTRNGLTDDFVSYLCCNEDSVVWLGTDTGLDKIFLKNGQYTVGNISKSNNFFEGVVRIVTSNDSTVWALTNQGTIFKLIKRSPPANPPATPAILASLKINGVMQDELSKKFSYSQNNLTFYIAAPSFIDEKSIQYRYLLKGSGNEQWSEPSNNTIFNFINLPPGNYNFQVRCEFPESMYPPQNFSYEFVISPPWWKTWWFRIPAALLLIALIVFSFRFYYQGKLEKQRAILEKQQAVESERTRIAADMHDDLGAGLTKIRFITDNILEKNNAGETTETELEKLKHFSSELLESMGEIIWATSEKNNLLSNTLYYLRSYAVNYCEENNMDCQFALPENFEERIVSGNTRRNIFLLLKECLHNTVKHADATTVTIEANVKDKLQLIIKDNGKGFSENGMTISGNGLINMKKRVKELEGAIHFENKQGTTIVIELPFVPNQSTIG